MSEQIYYSRKKSGFLSFLFAFSFLGFSLFTANQITAHSNVQILRVEPFAFFGNYQSVTVNLADNTNMSGYRNFSFLIQYDTTYLSYLSAQPDSLLIAGGWETFTPTPIATGLIRIDAEAGIAATSHFANQDGALCRVTFRVTNNTAYAYHGTLVQFYWEDCFDNRLESLNEDSLFVVDTARSYPSPQPPLPTPAALPSVAGIPDSCASLAYNGEPLSRSVTFVAEVVEMQNDEPLPKGDINRNGIINEPEDRDILADYFFRGLEVMVFQPIDIQVGQTDVNGDGIALTLSDFAFLQRLILGDSVPVLRNDWDPPLEIPWEYSPDTVIIHHNLALKTVSLSCPGRIVLMGIDIPVQLSDIHFTDSVVVYRDTSYHDRTKGLLLAGGLDGISNGTVFTYTGQSNTAGIGGVYDFQQRLLWNRIITTGQCGDFNATGTITIADLVYMVGFLFNSGPAPKDLGAGDINCSGTVTIADLVRLVAYLFNSGPVPCCQ